MQIKRDLGYYLAPLKGCVEVFVCCQSIAQICLAEFLGTLVRPLNGVPPIGDLLRPYFPGTVVAKTNSTRPTSAARVNTNALIRVKA